ncbi:NAD(P)H-quinone oxidoreductase [Novosphingopyxis sp. YJ-S2-01]|uniref:NAD(P)H-quinone oxidoreductase n=1 Tax=Novosphingopyxis sp. YJ-S2-01 TaxID=2794021 RepID=UPI0018DB78F3|nr:NAD(P)H-quinone oxidoreductase [Novosphingopyxis sp. YJ-S2-01]MBH9537035.1 NAD(P)H-quinone oxidoreductase [Novosphingopyxis sp. YJ-S2-01]
MSRSADLPGTMTCVEIGEPGGPDALKPAERAVPRPQEGEVLIRVAAAGVNRPDVLQRKGNYPPPPGASDLPGLEIAGEIVALGEGVGEEMLGQPVCALVSGGGYAEYCTAPVGQCLSVPEGVSMEEAAALPETLFTVWHNVFERGYAAQGERLLVHGGTSGIGTMAIKLAKLFGITVYVTCGSDEKCEAAEKVGADAAINYKSSDFVEEIKRLTDGNGVNVVLDMVGGDYVPRNIQCLAEDGRHVSIAFQRGMSAEISIVQIMQRRLVLTGSTLRARDTGFKTLLADEIANNVWPFVEEGKLRAEIDKVFPLKEAAAAHAHMEAGDHIGKIILKT